MQRVNWEKLTNTNDKSDLIVLFGFASKLFSGREFYEYHANTDTGGEARNLLRTRGVTVARQLARKALRRRGVDITV